MSIANRQQYEVNCATRQLHTLSFANYDGSGNLTGSQEGGRWEIVVPQTLGEALVDRVCQHIPQPNPR